jgi:hypothetical protein
MIFVCGNPNQSVHLFLERVFQSGPWDSSKSCEFREEKPFPKDKYFLSDKASDNKIDKSIIVSNSESMEDIWRFWENLCHKIFGLSGQHEIWHCLHEWRNDDAKILDTKQELVPKYIWYSVLH